MKHFLIILLVSISITLKAQIHANVEKILNVPVYMYSYPTSDFEEIKTFGAFFSELSSSLGGETSVNDIVKEIINKAKNQQKKGKVDEFDAIIINPDDYSGILIELSDNTNLRSEVIKVLNVPVFMYSYPVDEFEEVDEYEATLSFLVGESSLSERTKEIVKKAKRRQE